MLLPLYLFNTKGLMLLVKWNISTLYGRNLYFNCFPKRGNLRALLRRNCTSTCFCRCVCLTLKDWCYWSNETSALSMAEICTSIVLPNVEIWNRLYPLYITIYIRKVQHKNWQAERAKIWWMYVQITFRIWTESMWELILSPPKDKKV